MRKIPGCLAGLAAGLGVGLAASGAAALDCDAGKVSAGETVFKRCKGCHRVEPGENGVGPTLFGVVGRAVAGVPGYDYSDAMKAYAAAMPVWDENHLMIYLEKPREIVEGTTMAFVGVRRAVDREAVICYLGRVR